MFTAALKGSLRETMREEKKILAEGITRAVRAEARKLRTQWRRQVRRAKLGKNLVQAVQVIDRPGGRRFSMRAASLVVSKADRIHEAFTADRFIRTRNGTYIVIALQAARDEGFGESLRRSEGNRPRRYSELEKALSQGRAFIPKRTGNGNILLLAKSTKQPWFLLVKDGVRLRKRIDFDGPTRVAEGLLGPRIIEEIAKAERRAANRRR